MRNIRFILSSLCGIILEYSILFLIVYFFNHDVSVSLSILLNLFSFNFIIVLITKLMLRSKQFVKESSEELTNEEIIKLVDDFNHKYHHHVQIIVTSMVQPNPAWCIGKYIFINKAYPIDDIYLPGVVAHELGHVKSGLAKYCIYASIKYSTIIAKIIFLLFTIIRKSRYKTLKKIVCPFLLCLYNIFSLNDLIFVYPFIRNDEYIANSFACDCGYGYHIRTYYGHGLKEEELSPIRKMDYAHPTVEKMIDKINQKLKIKKEYHNLYYINHQLILAYIDTYTFTIPEFINEISYDAIISDKLKKIKANQPIVIKGRLNLKQLEELIIPNCNLTYANIKYLTNLKVLKVKEEIIDNLILYNIDDIPVLNKIKTKRQENN